ncbi:MAG: N-acetylmuramoyl-L-alanine amidase [Planctomycetaceae bacterium]|nr:N-acetylmuramoyl-L-alanine amidase [Planctomycetaceae bacterium]
MLAGPVTAAVSGQTPGDRRNNHTDSNGEYSPELLWSGNEAGQVWICPSSPGKTGRDEISEMKFAPDDGHAQIRLVFADSQEGAEEVSGLSAVSEGNGWRATVPESDWQYIVLHHSGTDSGSVQSIHADHRRRTDSVGNPWLGIGYHFVIGNGSGMADGQVAATFRWGDQIHGAHSGHAAYNARGIGICLIGNFEEAGPTTRQLQSLRRLVRTLASRHEIPADRVLGHSTIKATACPGRLFPMNQIREVVKHHGGQP